MKDLLNYISKYLNGNIVNYQTLSGGDISKSYVLSTKTDRFFLKINSDCEITDLFLKEKEGLEAIRNTKTIATPEIYHLGKFKNSSFMILQYIERKHPDDADFTRLGHQLALLHKNGQSTFGFNTDNYIGSLNQSNHSRDDWTSFYINERLIPQFELSVSRNLLVPTDIPKKDKLLNVCNALFSDIKPSFLHGDLWNGNFMISSDGVPYLIDPAVYYGHHEIDIAMTKLFGGFSKSFYRAYQEHFNVKIDNDDRCVLYQLYYLLVHLNLFGLTYKSSVKNILNRIFKN
jgi:fructosamine-3-kinase